MCEVVGSVLTESLNHSGCLLFCIIINRTPEAVKRILQESVLCYHKVS